MFLSRRNQRQLLHSAAGDPEAPVEPVQDVTGDFILLQQDRNRLSHIVAGRSRAAAGGIGSHRVTQLIGKAEIIDNQAARLLAEHAVHASNRLHQPVAPHGLVSVHGMQTRSIKARQPHVPHDHDAKRILAVFEAVRQRSAFFLITDVRLPFRSVVGTARHDDLHDGVL